MDKKQLKAMIFLLDDPDDGIFFKIREELLAVGDPVIPVLEDTWENLFSQRDTKSLELLQARIETLIHDIQLSSTIESLSRWADTNGSLLDGALLVAQYQYPDIKEEKIHRTIKQLKNEVSSFLVDRRSPKQQVDAMNHVLFGVNGFRGNTKNFHAPQNSFITDVLENKRGNPLSLSMLYIIIGRLVGLPLYGINLPRHFIVAYKKSNEDIEFYINPFSRGTVFSKNDITQFLQQLELKPRPTYYETCSNTDMIERSLVNLEYAYEKLGYTQKIDEIRMLMKAMA